jgi:membrane fusion protein (multidrug efflux system)
LQNKLIRNYQLNLGSVGLVIISIILFNLLLSSCGKQKSSGKPERPLAVKFEQAKIEPISLDFTTGAELKAAELVEVAARQQGQVTRILVSEGSYVQKGTQLIKIKGDAFDADLKRTKKDFEIYQKLYDEGAISELELLSFRTAYDKARANYNDLNLRAVISGVVGEIYIDTGDFVNVGTKILELVKVDPLEVSYNLPEKLLRYVKLGQMVSVKTPAFPDELFSARVTFISPIIDRQTRTLLVRARLLDAKNLLKPNMYVSVTQQLEDVRDHVVIREEALYLDQGQEYVYLAENMSAEERQQFLDKLASQPGPPADPDQKYFIARRLPVQTGIRKTGKVEIVDGIKAGDQVIYAGLYSIYPGAKLINVSK